MVLKDFDNTEHPMVCLACGHRYKLFGRQISSGNFERLLDRCPECSRSQGELLSVARRLEEYVVFSKNHLTIAQIAALHQGDKA